MWNEIHTWDESTGQESYVGLLSATPEDDYYLALVGNYFYYYSGDGSIIRKIDVTQANTDYFDVATNIFPR